MMNLGEPDQAFALSMIPNDGIGLARMEFVINNYIKIHPMALVHPEKVTDEAVKAKISLTLPTGTRTRKTILSGNCRRASGRSQPPFTPSRSWSG